jgi:hypothetical protein
MDDLTDLYRSRLFDRQYPIDEATQADAAQADPGKQQGFGEIKPIPRNAVEDLIGKLGTALEHAGVPLDTIGLDIPGMGRISAKDLLIGDSAEFLNNLADGFYPVSGSGETMRLNDGAWGAVDAIGIPGAVAGTAKAAVKGARAVGKKAATAAIGTAAAEGASNAIEGAAK